AIVEAGGESLTLISAVPEPSSSLLFALGLGTFILSLRRRAS
ncbi:MAG: PEP-CTERM sorting domain-containing protein, partial [Verrucomicrobiaceae bacterium]|nr:PEP-CTERM sorting domain-containing protein [Verrucomicrobiaceae bacterium]